jgi:hypothetical protein
LIVALRVNAHIQKALQLARELTYLADQGEADARDNGCRALFRVILDCAYRVREHAEREREAHRAWGIWDRDGIETVIDCEPRTRR